MIAVNRYGAYEMLDFIQPCLAMSTGSHTHVQELPARYVCRLIAIFRTNCHPYDTMDWDKYNITDVTYAKYPMTRVIKVEDIVCILSNKYELKEFINKKMKK